MSALISISEEMTLLSSVMFDTRNISVVADKLFPEHFAEESHAKLYQEAIESFIKKEVFNDLIAMERYPSLEGKISEIASVPPVSKDTLVLIADRILRSWERREIVNKLEEIKKDAIAGRDIDFSVLQSTSTSTVGVRPNIDIIKRMEEMSSSLAEDKGTGISELDASLNLEPGSLIIIAARPSMGKTVMAASVALHLAEKNEGSLVFSLEMNSESLMARLIANRSGEPIGNILKGRIKNFNAYKKAKSEIENLPLYITDDSCDEVALYNMASSMIRKHPEIKNVFIDHLTYIKKRGNSQNEHLRIGEITKTLKRLAKEFGIKVWLLSQLSRSIESRPNRRPMLSDLRESGSIEEDSDVVLGLYRDSYYASRETGEKEDKITESEILILKNRNGPVSTAHTYFIGEISKFTDRPPAHCDVVEYVPDVEQVNNNDGYMNTDYSNVDIGAEQPSLIVDMPTL